MLDINNDINLYALIAIIIIVPIFLTFIFSIWISKKTLQFQKKIECWGIFIKLVSTFTTIAAGALIIGKFTIEQQSNLRQEHAVKAYELQLKEVEFERLKHAERTKLLNEAARVAASIATQTRTDEIANTYSSDKDLIKRFNELWFADLIGIEVRGGQVEQKMIEFRRKLYNEPAEGKYSILDILFGDDQKTKSAPEGSIQKIAIDISIAVKDEIEKSEIKLNMEVHKANKIWERYRNAIPSENNSKPIN